MNETLASIDIGANSIRMSIGENSEVKLKLIDNLVHPLRLGKDSFLKRYIKPENLEEAIRVLEGFKLKLKEYGVKKYRVVATSPLRDIENQEFFLEQIRSKTGFNVEILERSEEERLVFLGLKYKMKNFKDYVKKGVMIAKVGSGDVEISLLKSGDFFVSRSIPIGGLRLRQNLKDVPEEYFPDAVEKFVVSDFRMLTQALPEINAEYVIGAGTLLRIIHSLAGTDKNPEINSSDLKKLYRDLKKLSISQISETYKLPSEYADLILPTTYLYIKLLELTKAKSIIFEDISFTECLLLELGGFFKNKFFVKKVWKSAIRIGEKYQFDGQHGIQVSKIATKIFDGLEHIHNLGSKHKFLLKLAALWHDIGIYINNSAHHKHSYYLIKNIEMPGISYDDLQLIANIARYHRRSLPKKYHIEYMSLNDSDRIIVSKLASILRIADALDRSHIRSVKNICVKTENNQIFLDVNFKEDAWLEKLYFKKKKDLFLHVFGINLELIERSK